MSTTKDAAFLAFLDNIIVDCGDCGERYPNREGYSRIREQAYSDEDLVAVAYSKEAESHPFFLDPESHGSAYTATLETLIHLRIYWRDAYTEMTEGKPLDGMCEDIDAVIANLRKIKTAIQTTAQPNKTLVKLLEDKQNRLETARVTAESTARDNARSIQLSEIERDKARITLELGRMLEYTPVELLAQAGNK